MGNEVHPQIEMLSPQSLRPNPRNSRVHSKRQIRQLAKTMNAMGFVGAIIIDETNTILAGHARFEAGKVRGMRLLPTLRVTGLSETQKRAFSLADNKLNEWGGWDREILVAELGDLASLLPDLELDLSITGFQSAEIDSLFADLVPRPAPEDAPPTFDPETVTVPGDLWVLSGHRLLCGNALCTTDVDRLIHGARARMVFTDPPYNVRIRAVQGRGRIKHAEFAFASGEMSPREYVEFLENSLGNAARASVDGAVHYVCHDWRHVGEVGEAAGEVYGAMLNLCVWAKTNAGQGSFYRSAHELIGVYRVGVSGHQNNIELGKHGRNRSNVWQYPGVNSFGAGRLEALTMHPTVKPVALVADAMRDCTTKGDVVLDPFTGSGTTIVAAEKVGRKAFGLEIEPKYVDVAINRWEAYTKGEAVLDGDGRTYAEIRAARVEGLQSDEPNPKMGGAAISATPSHDAGGGGKGIGFRDERDVP
jgi:DNA modification methylase